MCARENTVKQPVCAVLKGLYFRGGYVQVILMEQLFVTRTPPSEEMISVLIGMITNSVGIPVLKSDCVQVSRPSCTTLTKN